MRELLKVNNQDVLLMSLLLASTDFKHCSGASIADFEQLNTSLGAFVFHPA